jgi:hypothetical protein
MLRQIYTVLDLAASGTEYPAYRRRDVLLLKRPKDDLDWPSLWHNPGNILQTKDFIDRPDKPQEGAFERIRMAELGGAVYLDQPLFVPAPHPIYGWSTRGGVRADLFIGFVDPELELPINAMWKPVSEIVDMNDIVRMSGHLIGLAFSYYRMNMRAR